eukprot:831678-Amphidinium_carterae.1
MERDQYTCRSVQIVCGSMLLFQDILEQAISEHSIRARAYTRVTLAWGTASTSCAWQGQDYQAVRGVQLLCKVICVKWAPITGTRQRKSPYFACQETPVYAQPFAKKKVGGSTWIALVVDDNVDGMLKLNCSSLARGLP